MPSSIPHHVNPPAGQPVAMAPYNFVPLPQAIFTVEDGFDVGGQKVKPWEHHDQFVPGTHSGWIDLSIEALTPIFIRGAGRFRNGQWDDSNKTRLRPEPFLDHAGRPTIPGSSLRGMIRNLVEILSFSKIQPVSRKQPFFRSMTTSRISKAYRKWFIEDLGELTSGFDITTQAAVSRSAAGYAATVRAGIVRINGTHQFIEECGLARSERRDIERAFGGKSAFVGTRPNLIPNPAMQHQPVHVTADSQPRDYFFARQVNRYGNERHPNLYLRFRRVQTIATAASANGPTNGVVVISGDMQSKHLEFVFQTSGALGTIPIPDEQWERFHDDDQMTPWQEQAFPKGQPHGGHRSRNGHLRDGEPVFFLCDPSKVDAGNPQGLVFFGRAQMFRFPYDETPTGLVPSVLRNAGLDLTEALFGRVPVKMSCGDNEQPDRKAIKGRVFFEDCVVHGQGEWLEPQIVPQILGSPKVTAYQQYLTQDRSAKSTDHTTYINGDRTTIRGHKLYWHRWDGTGLGQVTVQPPEQHRRLLDDLRSARPRDTQHTLIQPVVATSPTGTRTTFTGRIRFENLTDIELGALLSALNLPQNCAHKIGMAKPLGLGSICITASLSLIDRKQRYAMWLSSDVATGDEEKFVGAFATAMTRHANDSGEALVASPAGLRRIARLDALFRILDFDRRPGRGATEYLSLEGFKPRNVLPTPHRVLGEEEPKWPGPVPSAKPEESHSRSSSTESSDRVIASSSSPLPPRTPSPPQPKLKQGKETVKVKLLKRLNGGKARIQLESGETLECVAINVGTPIADDDTFIADVEWKDGKPVRAKYKRAS